MVCRQGEPRSDWLDLLYTGAGHSISDRVLVAAS
jgi:hypothetical protein